MEYCDANHLSHRYKFDIAGTPATKTDKISSKIVYFGALFALIFIFIGMYDFLDYYPKNKTVFDALEPTESSHLFPLWLFDFSLIFLGFGIFYSIIREVVKYRKFSFDGKQFKIINRELGKQKEILYEPLSKYKGVRYRIAFIQYGILNKNKYIVELLHKEPNKTVPLYMSLNGNHFRKIAKDYAMQLNKPLIAETDNGEVTIKLDDLNKSLKELYKEGKLQDNYDSYEQLPSSVAFVRKKDKIVLKVRKVVGDAYNLLAIVLILCGIGLLSYNFKLLTQLFSNNVLAWMYVVILSGIVLSVFILFRKDKIAIKRPKIVHVEKFFGFSRKSNEMLKQDIENIDVTVNPSTGRAGVAIYSVDNVIIFAKKLPLEDLRWIKKFLIHEIIK